jgi:transcriptional regulator with XRE-family HTH domain
MNNIYSHVAARIRKARKDQRLPLEELAERSGIAASYLGQIERGERKPSLKTFATISAALRIPPGILIGDGQSGIPEGAGLWEKRFSALLDGTPEERRHLVYETIRFVLRRLRKVRKAPRK